MTPRRRSPWLSAMNARVLALLACILTLLAPAPSYAGGPPPAPGVWVTPGHALEGGDTVRVRARGLPASTEVLLVQCDSFGDRDSACDPSATVTTSAQGTLRTTLTLADPVLRRGDVGRPRPILCRADQCRIGVVVRDGIEPEQLLAESAPLRFRGSPATVAVSPATALPAARWVTVSGTAVGAAGRRVAIVQQVCFSLVQEVGCYAAGQVRHTRVRPDGGYRLAYRVTRSLPEDVDCAATGEMLGSCVVSATVLKRDGTPDLSFGYAPYGEPMAALGFTP